MGVGLGSDTGGFGGFGGPHGGSPGNPGFLVGFGAFDVAEVFLDEGLGEGVGVASGAEPSQLTVYDGFPRLILSLVGFEGTSGSSGSAVGPGLVVSQLIQPDGCPRLI